MMRSAKVCRRVFFFFFFFFFMQHYFSREYIILLIPMWRIMSQESGRRKKILRQASIVASPTPKLPLKIINIFLKKVIYTSYSKLSNELKNRSSSSWVIALKQHFDCLIHSLKNHFAYQISMPFEVWVPWTIHYEMDMLYFKKAIIFVR